MKLSFLQPSIENPHSGTGENRGSFHRQHHSLGAAFFAIERNRTAAPMDRDFLAFE